MTDYQPRDGDKVTVAMTVRDDGTGDYYLYSLHAVIVPRGTAHLIANGDVTLADPEATS